MGSGGRYGPWIALLGIAVVTTLAMGYPSRFKLGATAAGLIAGGALGNLADRAFRGDEGFLHGAVVDFIDPNWWPIFNIADIGVTVGGVLLVLGSLLESRRQPEQLSESQAESQPEPEHEPQHGTDATA